MVSENNTNTESHWSNRSRHSPRIFDKNIIELDVSTVNNKCDFMRSLNLYYLKKSKEADPAVNSSMSKSHNSIPLKKCSVVISRLMCNVCRAPLKNQSRINYHKTLHQTEKNIRYFRKQIVKSHKKQRSKRKRNAAITLILKIGCEVITKVYCKKKYLSISCLRKYQSLNYNILNDDLTDDSVFHTRATEQQLARRREMAAVLVENELQRVRASNYCNQEEVQNIMSSSSNSSKEVIEIDCASDNDDIQEVLYIRKSTDVSTPIDVNNKASSSLQRNIPTPVKTCEIITIDDEICDNIEDDCIIIDKRSPNNNCLNSDENCYLINTSSSSSASSKTQKEVDAGRGKSFSNAFTDDTIFMDQKKENAQFNLTENSSLREIEKENTNNGDSTIKVSQSAAPLRLINN